MAAAECTVGAETLIRSAPATRPVWYLVGVSRTKVRTILVAMLEQGHPGEFLVRDASEKPGPGEIAKYKMSVKESKQTVLTYLIIKTAAGAGLPDDDDIIQSYTAGSGPSAPAGPAYSVYGTSERFASLEQLVEFYTVNQQDSMSIQLQTPRFKEYAAEALLMPDTEPARAPPKPRLVPAPQARSGLDDLTKKMTGGGYGAASYNFAAPNHREGEYAETPPAETIVEIVEVVDDQAIYDIAAMGDAEYIESGPTPTSATRPESASVAVQDAVTEDLAPVDFEPTANNDAEYLECVDTVDTSDPAEPGPGGDPGGPAQPLFESNDFVLDKSHESVRLKSVARGNPLFQEDDGHDAVGHNLSDRAGEAIPEHEDPEPENDYDPATMYRDESANMPAVTYRRKRPDSTYSSLSAEVTYGNRPKSEAVYAIAGMGADVSTDPTTRRGTDWDESNYGLSGQAAEERDAIYGLANTSNRDSQVYGAPLSDAERSDGFYGNRGADDRENEGEYANREPADSSTYGMNGTYQLGTDMKFRLGQMRLGRDVDINVDDESEQDDCDDVYPVAQLGDGAKSKKRNQGRKKARPKSEGPYMLAIFPDNNRNSVISAGSTYGTQGGEGVYGLSGKAVAESDAVYGMAADGGGNASEPTYGRGSLRLEREDTDHGGDDDLEGLYGRGSVRGSRKPGQGRARPVSALYGLGSHFNDILSHDTETDGSPGSSPVMTRRGRSSIRRITPRVTGMNKALTLLGISEEESKNPSPLPASKSPSCKKKTFFSKFVGKK